VQQNDRTTAGRADIDVADVQEAGRDLVDPRGEDLDHVRSDRNVAGG
jgi:hypothetical protein